MKSVKYKFWGNRTIFLNADSFQCMWLMYNYIVDWEEFNLIKNYVQQKDQLADIGANVGYYTMWMTKFISGEGKVHVFEPDENNFERLSKNITANRIEDLICTNKIALSDTDGQLNFTKGLDERNHIAFKHEENVSFIPAKKIDTYIASKNITSIAYMKIDVEGFEYLVLKGADEALSKKRIEILQLEINNSIQNSNTTADSLLQLLDRYDYTLCRYDVKVNKLLPQAFSNNRENYFAVYNLEKTNERLKKNHFTTKKVLTETGT
jgi:FkbM family methyltransferase